MTPDDEIDLEIHGEIEAFVDRMQRKFTLTEREVFERMTAYVENYDDAASFLDPAMIAAYVRGKAA